MTPISWLKLKFFLRYYIWRCNRDCRTYVIEVDGRPMAILLSYEHYKNLLEVE